MPPEEPVLIVTPNKSAYDLLRELVAESMALELPGHVVAFETMLPVRITSEDLDRWAHGNGDMLRIGFWVTGDGVDPVAYPDPETKRSPFEE